MDEHYAQRYAENVASTSTTTRGLWISLICLTQMKTNSIAREKLQTPRAKTSSRESQEIMPIQGPTYGELQATLIT